MGQDRYSSRYTGLDDPFWHKLLVNVQERHAAFTVPWLVHSTRRYLLEIQKHAQKIGAVIVNNMVGEFQLLCMYVPQKTFSCAMSVTRGAPLTFLKRQ